MANPSQPAVTANEHYEALLAKHYAWMCGAHSERVAQQRALFERLGIAPDASSVMPEQQRASAPLDFVALGYAALDLGCGTGFQSLALAELGFNVIAIDANADLLQELEQHRGVLKIRAVRHDLCDVARCPGLPPQSALAVCMGDTLTHLPSHEAVAAFFADVARLLAPGAKFVVGYRDMSAELRGLDRFLPVRSDSDRAMTCFLEYEERAVLVHDLIYTREGAGWKLHKSAYRKLRLPLDSVLDGLRGAGFTIRSQETAMGMSTVVAERSGPPALP